MHFSFEASATPVPHSTLIPSSAFQVPHDPSELEPMEMEKKLPFVNSPSCRHFERKLTKIAIEAAHNNQTHKHSSASLPAAGQSSVLQKSVRKSSNSPLPSFNPDIVLPTVDLTNECSRRKPLLKKSISESVFPFIPLAHPRSRARTLVIHGDCASNAPKSAPASPNLNCTKDCLSRQMSMSQNDLSKLGSDTMPMNRVLSSPCSFAMGDDSTDSKSPEPDKGRLSYQTSLSELFNLLTDCGSNSTLPRMERVVEIDNALEQEQIGDEVPGSIVDGGIDSVVSSAQKFGEFSTTHVTSKANNSPVVAASLTTPIDTALPKEVEERKKGGIFASHADELRRWASQGCEGRQDLSRETRLTGHSISADRYVYCHGSHINVAY